MVLLSFDSGTSGSKIIAGYSCNKSNEFKEEYFFSDPSLRKLTNRSYLNYLEEVQSSKINSDSLFSNLISYIDPITNTKVFYEVGKSAAKSGFIDCKERKFVKIITKILTFIGFLASSKLQTNSVAIDLGILLPYDEIKDRQILANLLRKVDNIIFNGRKIALVFNRIDCKPEGYGLFDLVRKFETVGILIMGHSDTTYLVFENSRLNTNLSQTFPETGMHGLLRELNYNVGSEIETAKTIAQAGKKIDSATIRQLTQTKTEEEVNILKSSIKEAKFQYWLEKETELKSVIQETDILVVSGGNAGYFSQELKQFLQTNYKVKVDWASKNGKEFCQKFAITSEKNILAQRYSDCYSYYKYLLKNYNFASGRKTA